MHDDRNSQKARTKEPNLKCRPDSAKAAKGSGGSRPFIPWDKTKKCD